MGIKHPMNNNNNMIGRVPVPNVDKKVFVCLASCRSPLFYNRKKFFLRLHNL